MALPEWFLLISLSKFCRPASFHLAKVLLMCGDSSLAVTIRGALCSSVRSFFCDFPSLLHAEQYTMKSQIWPEVLPWQSRSQFGGSYYARRARAYTQSLHSAGWWCQIAWWLLLIVKPYSRLGTSMMRQSCILSLWRPQLPTQHVAQNPFAPDYIAAALLPLSIGELLMRRFDYWSPLRAFAWFWNCHLRSQYPWSWQVTESQLGCQFEHVWCLIWIDIFVTTYFYWTHCIGLGCKILYYEINFKQCALHLLKLTWKFGILLLRSGLFAKTERRSERLRAAWMMTKEARALSARLCIKITESTTPRSQYETSECAVHPSLKKYVWVEWPPEIALQYQSWLFVYSSASMWRPYWAACMDGVHCLYHLQPSLRIDYFCLWFITHSFSLSTLGSSLLSLWSCQPVQGC